MKKIVVSSLLTTLSLITFSANANTPINELDNIIIEYVDTCTVKVTADCNRDGVPELTAIVDCEHADEMVRIFREFCN